MNCSCEIDVYEGDCEPASLFKQNTRKARKIHVCTECKRDIQVSEMYEHVSYLFEGKFWQDKTCSDCLSAMAQFYPHGGYYPGELWNDIRSAVEEWGEGISENCITQLTDAARNKLCDMIELANR
jgi:hypothetical protein